MTADELLERLIDFAAGVGKVVDALPDTRMGAARRRPVGARRESESVNRMIGILHTHEIAN